MASSTEQQPSLIEKVKRFFSRFTITPWVKYLLWANIGVALLTLTGLFSLESVVGQLALDVDTVLGRPWTLLTHMFVHGGWMHLLFNMIALFFFGPPLEKKLGGKKFIQYYLLCGLGAALISLALTPWVGSKPMVGASGALFGVFLGFALNYPDTKVYLMFLIPVRAMTLLWGGAAFSLGVTGAVVFFGLETRVAEWAHFGGPLTGLLYLRGAKFGRGAFRVIRRWGQNRSDATNTVDGIRKDFHGKARGEEEKRLSEILAKVREEGPGALTPREQRFFKQASSRMKDGEW